MTEIISNRDRAFLVVLGRLQKHRGLLAGFYAPRPIPTHPSAVLLADRIALRTGASFRCTNFLRGRTLTDATGVPALASKGIGDAGGIQKYKKHDRA